MLSAAVQTHDVVRVMRRVRKHETPVRNADQNSQRFDLELLSSSPSSFMSSSLNFPSIPATSVPRSLAWVRAAAPASALLEMAVFLAVCARVAKERMTLEFASHSTTNLSASCWRMRCMVVHCKGKKRRPVFCTEHSSAKWAAHTKLYAVLR